MQGYCGEETKYHPKFQSLLVLLLSDTVKWAGRILDSLFDLWEQVYMIHQTSAVEKSCEHVHI